MGDIGVDIRHAWRRLRAAPAFTLFSITTLAMAIGATSATYAVIREATATLPGVAEPDRVAVVYRNPEGSLPMASFSWPDFQDLRARQTVFASLAGWRMFRSSISGNGWSETTWGELVTGEYFQTLGVTAARGRLLQPFDDRTEAPAVAVISYALWQRAFAGSPDVIGRSIKVSGQIFDIVGVASRDFPGLFNGGLLPSGVWVTMGSAKRLPLEGSGVTFAPDARDRYWVMAHGRLAPGRSLDEARSELARIGEELDRGASMGRSAWGARSETGRVQGVPVVVFQFVTLGLMLLVGLVLIVACTNLTNLTLARLTGRRTEMAVRAALGCTRGRLIRDMLIESTMLAVAGGLAGLGLTWLLTTAIARTPLYIGNGSLLLTPRVSIAVLAAAALTTSLALVIAGVIPAWRTSRLDLRRIIAADTSGALLRWRGRRYLITLQVAVSVVLIALAATSVKQIAANLAVDTGIDLDQLAIAQVDFGDQRYDEARARQIVDAVISQMSRRHDVEAAAVSSGLPMSGALSTPGATLSGQGVSAAVELMASTPPVLRTLGVTLTGGRALQASDDPGALPVVVLSEMAANAVFGTTDVIGRDIQIERRRWAGEAPHRIRTARIVGIAADTDTASGGRRDHGTAYVPLAQHYEGRLLVSVRIAQPESVLGDLRKAFSSIDPYLAVTQVGTGRALVGPSNVFSQVMLIVSGTLGAFAMALAMAGLSGVLSQLVAGRRREIGVRLALGAPAAAVRRMIINDGMRPVVLGLALGLGLAGVARLGLRPLFQRLVPALDTSLMVGVATLVVIIGLIVCTVPALLASRVDPNTALRYE
jgi:predicted permease